MSDVRAAIEAGLCGPEPTDDDDIDAWIAYYAAMSDAAALLRDEAHLADDLDGAGVAAELVEKCEWAIEQLRNASHE